jgi:SAM-dependent methyltransferase
MSSALRRPGQGVRNVVRFNWDFYACGAVAAVLGSVGLLGWGHWLPDAGRWLGWLGVGVGLYLLLASLLVSWWVYDAADLYRWQWLPAFLEHPAPLRALNIHLGFDETTRPLRQLFPACSWQSADLFNSLSQPEKSIVRARQLYPPDGAARPAAPHELPYGPAEFAVVALLFAAHEVRKAQQRRQLLAEVCRVLQPGGQLVLVEHVRDMANTLAFGPGVLHFFGVREWERVAAEVGLQLYKTQRQTPFVRAWLFTAPTTS